MQRFVPLPGVCVENVKRFKATGLDYELSSIRLKNGRSFSQAVVREGCIVKVEGYSKIPFLSDDVALVSLR